MPSPPVFIFDDLSLSYPQGAHLKTSHMTDWVRPMVKYLRKNSSALCVQCETLKHFCSNH